MAKHSLTTLGIRICIVSIILLVLGVVAVHPKTVIETEIDEAVIFVAILFLVIGIVAIIKDKLNRSSSPQSMNQGNCSSKRETPLAN